MKTSKITLNYETLDLADRFMKIIEKAVSERGGIRRYLNDLDAYSPETFTHSVNVAAITFNELSKNKDFSEKEIEVYTMAALTHDIGKLTVPLDVLHSQRDFRLEIKEIDEDKSLCEKERINKRNSVLNEKDVFLDCMDMHSINGYTKADEYGLTDAEKMISLSHHIGENAIEHDLGFDDIEFSNCIYKKSWNCEENKNIIKSFLIESFSLLSEKDLIAIDVISMADITEALTAERSYKSIAVPWNNEHLNQLKENVETCKIYENYNKTTIIDVLNSYCKSNMERKLSFFGKYAVSTIENLKNDFENYVEIKNVPERSKYSKFISDIKNLDLPHLIMIHTRILDSEYVSESEVNKEKTEMEI